MLIVVNLSSYLWLAMKQKLESCLVVIMRIEICNGSLTFIFEKAAVGQND